MPVATAAVECTNSRGHSVMRMTPARQLQHKPSWPSRWTDGKKDRGLEEPRRRFAAGEIDDAEYDHRREVLRGGPPGT